VLYVYALTDAPERPLPDCRGHRGARLCVHAHDGVAAVCTRHGHIEPRPDEAALWRHERVTEALMADRAVLPVRFGTTVADEDALTAMLAERHAEFRAGLERVRGRVEIGVRALWTPPGPAPEPDAAAGAEAAEGPGRAYLRARLDERARAERLADALHGALAPRAAAARRRVLVTPRMLLSAAYLIERDGVDEFLAAVDAVAAEHPKVQLLCTGPWPAHSFAAGDGERP
jgi:glycosyltransferase involved in cell wall biosynthesis